MTIHRPTVRRPGAALLACMLAASVAIMVGGPAEAAVVATVPLATAANYAVLGASTVTNTNNSTLDGSLGLWPGTSITGFPPGLVIAPGTTDTTNAAAQQAQSDLTAAYVNAAGRPVDASTPADLANLNLQPGVYAGPDKSPLSLTGPLVLDGGGDLGSVFIFQTDSTLITGSGSTVTLVNGAQECNVFWQVGSSATLGTGSVFAGNILALAAVTVTNSVTVHGRALARTEAVTLDNDTFTKPTCAQVTSGTGTTGGTGSTATGTGGSGTADSTTGGGTATTTAGSATTATTTAGGATATTTPGGATATTTPGGGTATSLTRAGTPGITTAAPGTPGVVGPPRTGGGPVQNRGFPWPAVLLASLLGGVGTAGALFSRRGRPSGAGPTADR